MAVEKFLKLDDYYVSISNTELNQILRDDDNNRILAEDAVLYEIKGYLGTKYKTDNVFKPLIVWDRTRNYKIGERLYLNATTYVGATTYNTYTTVLYNGSVYECILTTTGNLPTNATYWRLLGEKGYYYPVALAYNGVTSYVAGNVVSYLGYNYVNISDCTEILPTETAYWSVASKIGEYYDYTIALNQLPSNTTYWTNEDARNRLVMRYMIDLVIYDLMSSSPRQITELRVKRRDDAVSFLKGLGNTTSIDIPLISDDPIDGSRITWDSQSQLNHYY